MRVELFIDPVSGWSWWAPALLVEDEPRADQERAEARQRPAGQGLLMRLLGRVSAWFGIASRPQRAPGSRSSWPAGPQGRQPPGAATAASGAGGARDRRPWSATDAAGSAGRKRSGG
jgi:hypothetical protein